MTPHLMSCNTLTCLYACVCMCVCVCVVRCVCRDGVPASILGEALDRAKEGRLEILKSMKAVQPSGPRLDVKETALKAMVTFVLNMLFLLL